MNTAPAPSPRARRRWRERHEPAQRQRSARSSRRNARRCRTGCAASIGPAGWRRRAAIHRRRSNVVDRRDVVEQRLPRLLDQPARERRSALPRPHDGRRDRRGRRRVVAATTAITTLRLPGRARADLRNIWRPRRAESEGDDQLVGPADALAIAGIEGVEGHAPRAGCALQHDHRVGGSEHRQAVARRRGIRDVAAERAAILDLHAADLTRGGREHRQARAHERRSDEIGVRRERADEEDVAARLDGPQRVEPPQVHEPRILQRAEVEGHVDPRSPPSARLGPSVAQHLQRVGQRPWFEQRAVRRSSPTSEGTAENAEIANHSGNAFILLTSTCRRGSRPLRTSRSAPVLSVPCSAVSFFLGRVRSL